MSLWHRAALLGLFAVLSASCSPALNWREVRLDRLQVWLPCKPDHAERKVSLGPRDVSLQMAGCEAAGGLYAVSHVRVAEPDQVAATLAAWRQASLNNLRDGVVQTRPLRLAKTGPAEMLEVQARQPDGHPVQARLLWLTSGLDLYHVAVYGEKLSAEMTDLFFSELVVQ